MNSENTAGTQLVVLIHGLGRTCRMMYSVELALKQKGFAVWNKSYPSTKHRIEDLVERVIVPAIAYAKAQQFDTVHFVGHSLGGILIRGYLNQYQPDNLGRVVLIAAPNKGSEVADKLMHFSLVRKIIGPAITQLGTAPDSFPNQLGPIDAEVGIILGTKTSDPWFSWFIPGEDDGKVSAQSAMLDEMRDVVRVPHGHTFITKAPEVVDHICHFIQFGYFAENNTEVLTTEQ